MSLFRFLRRAQGSRADVVVIGSGLVARTIALELARRGGRVAVLDADPPGTSPPVGLGIVAAGSGQPYEHMVETHGRTDARAIWEAGRESRELLVEFLEDVGRDCGRESRGSFLLARDRGEAEALAESEDALRDEGFFGEFLDHYMLETHFDVSGFAGAYWAADDIELDGAELAATVHAAAVGAGAAFRPERALSIDADDSGAVIETGDVPIPASSVVVATDQVPIHLLPDLAPSLLPGRHARLVVETAPGASLPTCARTADGRAAWQVTPVGLSLAATGGPGSAPEDPTFLAELAARLNARPGSERPSFGPGGRCADLLPIVGPIPRAPVLAACGLGPLEASLAFVTARWVADLVLTGRDSTPGPFRAARPVVSPPV